MNKLKRILSLLIAMSMLNLAGIAVRADDGEVNIFKTDFDSYQVGTEEVVQQTLENLANPYSKISKSTDAAANIAGVKVDDEHGTSMEFNEAWQNVQIDLPQICTENDKALVSFDFIAPNVGDANGFLKVLGNANNNFASQIQLRWDGTAINYWDGVSGDGVKLYESAIPANKWVKIEYYLDHTEKYYITYVEGKPISKHAMYGEKTPLASLQFQTADDINADHKVYIDNLEVKKVSMPPYLKEFTASLSKTNIDAQRGELTINFDGELNTDTVNANNIKVYDETNEQYLDVAFDEINRESVTLLFTEDLKKECEYTIKFENVMDVYGQKLITESLVFNTNTAGTSETISVFQTDFDSYKIGNADTINSPLNDLTESYMAGLMTGQANGDGIFGENADENYGTSMKINEGGWRNIAIRGFDELTDEFVMSFDFREDSAVYMRILMNDNLVSPQACINGLTAKPESNEGTMLEYTPDVFTLKKWSVVEMYVNVREQYFALYADGKMVGEKQQFRENAESIRNIQIQKMGGGDMYIDNLSLDIVDGPPHINPITLSLSLENNIMPQNEKSLYLEFSDIIDTSTITNDTITVSEIIGDNSVNVPFTVSELTAKGLRLTFDNYLNEEASYRINLSDTVKSLAGNQLAVNHINFFPYSDALKVNNIEFTGYHGEIEDDETISPEIKYLTVYFNKPFDGSKVTGNIILTDENNAEVTAAVQYVSGKNAVRIRPEQMLKGGGSYTLSISNEILDAAYQKGFVTKEGCFARGNITVNEIDDKLSGSFAVNDTVAVKADIINTACTAESYVVMVGEYNNGKLGAYHFYNETVDANTTYKSKEYSVKLLSQADEIRAFVWKNPRTAQTLRRK